MSEEVVIHVRKAKVLKLMALGIGMTALGVWLTTSPGIGGKPAWYIHGVGWVSTGLFGFATLMGFAQLFRRRPALIIDRLGIIDQQGWFSVGRVHWLEIRGFRIVAMKRQKFLVVDLHNPRQYIDQGNALVRLIRGGNARLVGSPIALGSSTLDISFDELVRTVARFSSNVQNR